MIKHETQSALAAVIWSSILLGCGGDALPTEGEARAGSGQGSVVDPMLPADWVGYQLGVSPGTWTDLGHVDTPPAPGADQAPEDLNDHSFVKYDPVTQHVYKVEMSNEALRAVAQALEARGYADGSDGTVAADAGAASAESELAEPGAANDDPLVEKGWSGGTDDRIPKGLFEAPYNQSRYRKLGMAESAGKACSGTLVGDQDNPYMLFAAHCLWWEASQTYISGYKFAPRRDGCKKDDGSDMSNCDTTPYGEWSSGTWTVPTYYYNSCRYQEDLSDACIANDIAIKKLTQPSGETHPGAFAFTYEGEPYLASYEKWNRGYPACAQAGSPATGSTVNPNKPCRSYTLYGDRNQVELGAFTQTDSDGWRRVVEHSADQNFGMSGSAFYSEIGSTWKVWGVSSYGGNCYSGCSDPTPNKMRRITPWWYDVMLNTMGL